MLCTPNLLVAPEGLGSSALDFNPNFVALKDLTKAVLYWSSAPFAALLPRRPQ